MIAMAKPFIKSSAKHFDTISNVVDPRKTLEVYRNLHKKCWSIRQGGKVVCHTDYITLKDCKFIVQPAGRERVVREKKKNVHAFVRGLLCSPRESDHTPPFSWEFVKYNPYKSGSFYFDHTGGRYLSSQVCGYGYRRCAWYLSMGLDVNPYGATT